jgi:hypothetical protein
MKWKLYLPILLITGLLYCCSQPKHLIAYGTEQKLLVYSDSSLVDGKVQYKINDYTFKFSGFDFEDEIAGIMKEYNKSDFDFLKKNFLRGNETLVIKKGIQGITLNDTSQINFPLDYTINSVVDKLIKNGKFYLSQNNKFMRYMEYIYWEPQYQGSISSKWIVNNRTINEIIHGFVD